MKKISAKSSGSGKNESFNELSVGGVIDVSHFESPLWINKYIMCNRWLDGINKIKLKCKQTKNIGGVKSGWLCKSVSKHQRHLYKY